MIGYLSSAIWFFKSISNKQKLQFSLLVVGSLIASLLETISIISIIPVIELVLLDKEQLGFLDHLPDALNAYISVFLVSKSGFLWFFATLFTVASVFRMGLLWSQTRFIQNCGHVLAKKVYNNYLLGNYSQIRAMGDSEVISLTVNKCSETVTSVLGAVFSVTNAGFFSLMVLIFFANFNFGAFLFLVSSILIIYGLVFAGTGKILRSYSAQINTLLPRLLNTIIETIRSRKEIQLGYYSDYFSEKFSNLDKNIRRIRANVLFMGVVPKHLIEVFLVVILASSIEFGGAEILPDFGVIAAMLLAFHRVLPMFNTIYATLNSFQASSSMVHDVLKFASKSYTTINCHIPLETNKIGNWSSVEVQNLSFSYPSSDQGLAAPVNYVFERGKSYLLQGPSGVGKSTFLDCLSGIETLYSGTISINFEDGNVAEVIGLSQHLRISLAPQSAFVHEGTVLDNILLGQSSYSVDQLHNICSALEIYERPSLVNNETLLDLSRECGEGGLNLSGGQKQRVALARVLMQSADLIFCDESLSGLDVSTEKRILRRLRNSSAFECLIYVSHRNGVEDFFDGKIEIGKQ